MRPLLRGLLPLLIVVLAGCGNGTLADIWDSFPDEAFNPPDDGGGGGGGGGGLTLEEVAAIAGGQGVIGTVKNIALASVGPRTFAFLAAGPDGCHVVDVTEPENIVPASYITTIRPLVLTAPAELAGGRVDSVAVVSNALLVCVAVVPGTTGNCVTVFNLGALITAATSSTADLSAAFVPPTTPGTDAIAVTGDTVGKGGGVAGVLTEFFVATGTKLASARIELAGTWTLVSADIPLGTPTFTTVTDVAATSISGITAVFASGKRSDLEFAVVSLGVGIPLQTVVESEVQRVVDDGAVSTAGNYPLDLAIDTLNLFVTGNNEVFVYSITPTLSLASTVENTGNETIAVGATTGSFIVGAGDSVRVGTNALGQARVTGSLAFPGTFTIRGVAIRSTSTGLFFLACAGTGGLRILQVPSAPGP
jgi:hypothetical protein